VPLKIAVLSDAESIAMGIWTLKSEHIRTELAYYLRILRVTVSVKDWDRDG